MNCTIYITIGHSCMGKTTWSKKQNIKRFTYDELRHKKPVGIKTADFVEPMVREYGKDCIIDYLHACKANLDNDLNRYKDCNIVLVIFNISLEKWLSNIEKRNNILKKDHNKVKKLYEMFKKVKEYAFNLPYQKIIIKDEDQV